MSDKKISGEKHPVLVDARLLLQDILSHYSQLDCPDETEIERVFEETVKNHTVVLGGLSQIKSMFDAYTGNNIVTQQVDNVTTGKLKAGATFPPRFCVLPRGRLYNLAEIVTWLKGQYDIFAFLGWMKIEQCDEANARLDAEFSRLKQKMYT